jgi:proteasome assembly chaperone (PAC2) family protein
MKETYIKEFSQIQPNNPVLIEGLPGLGLSGQNRITISN